VFAAFGVLVCDEPSFHCRHPGAAIPGSHACPILSYFSSTELVKFLSSIRRDAMLRFAIERKQE
jgi:hypothetical protein